MDALESILTRRSVREYTGQPVPEALLHELLAAAMQAPSAGNQQPWHFVILTSHSQMEALADVLPYGQMLRTAPAAIAICANPEGIRHPAFWVQDCSAATQNLLLAAHARGLGAVWLGVYPLEVRVADLKRILELPGQAVPLCVVAIGYPLVSPGPPASRYDESRLHRDRW